MITAVVLAPAVTKGLRKLPQHVAAKLLGWVAGVEAFGGEAMRKIPGYHDESQRGAREGQRSIRLSRTYRAF